VWNWKEVAEVMFWNFLGETEELGKNMKNLSQDSQ
jgi:hypothetical protein